MSQCVPSWDLDENPTAPRVPLRSNSNSTPPDVPILDYEVAELTWENGQLSMNGLGLPKVPEKHPAAAAAARSTTPSSKCTWDKPRGSGTLESIVNQATTFPHRGKSIFDDVGAAADRDDLVPWFNPQRAASAAVMATTASAASNTMTMDGLVPCSNRTDEQQTTQVMHSVTCGGTLGRCMLGYSTRVGSFSGPTNREDEAVLAAKSARVGRVPVAPEWSGRDQSVSGSATCGRESQRVTLDTCEKESGMGFISTSMGSPENTSSAKQCTKTNAADDYDSICHSKKETGDEEDEKKGIGKSSLSTKRSRAADIHNQSERKRRDKINQRMKTLQKLVPNSSKSDKASMLDEVIEYLKQLQAQVQVMSKMNMSAMMLPMAMQQQLQMAMMPPMGMGLRMGIDMNTLGRHANNIGIPPVFHPPAAFMPLASRDASLGTDRSTTVKPDPLSTFFGGQPQPLTMDAYIRMVAMYQQLYQQPPASNSKG
ncbi:hypothetical protein QN277_024626 [Acacia crassicarpa]|uniref:BHLH domain-containing protein n=1 Tax=Acacia crassicarpa TaxID=499986 RepID=A0AAE1K7X3_9FABA|nr:hypothetical protein QN277_024626 [Acacia crassicarpa]